MSTGLAVVQQQRMIQQPDYESREILETIQATVAKGSTPAEFKMFIEIAKSTGLNPFLKEIWCAVPMKNGQRNPYGQVLIMAARDGYLRVANEHPMFDGMETRVERDEKTKTPIKAVCTVWRKDRTRPTICEAYFNEYYKPSFSDKPGVWDTYKSAMIGKVAEVLALKRSFSINGVVTEEEIGEQHQQEQPGSIEAARDVAKRKIAEKKAVAEDLGVSHADVIETAPLAICGPDLSAEREDLIDAIKQQLNSMAPEYHAADPASMAEYKRVVTGIQQEAFGVPSWKAITNLPLEGMRVGLAFLKAKANTRPEDSLNAVWADKFAMLADFQKEKARVGSMAYYELLDAHNVAKSNEFKTPAEGIKCYLALRSLPDFQKEENA